MKKFVGIVVLVVLCVAVFQVFSAISMRMTLTSKVESRLDAVSVNSQNQVQQAVIEDAGKLGLRLEPSQVVVRVEDAAAESFAQRAVGKTGLQFQNSRVTIEVRYAATVCGFAWPQEVRQTKVNQVSVSPPAIQREAMRVMDSQN